MNALLETKRNDLAALCDRHAVSRLELFGSGTARGFDPRRSDLDFLVDFRSGTPEEHTNRHFGLLADLQDLFGCPIDLVETRAIENPYFLEAIQPSRTPIYAA